MGAAPVGEACGFEILLGSVPTQRYLRMVRNRYMSLLSAFDDEQLAAGVAEIRAAHPQEEMPVTDTFAFLLGTAS